jgi:hypothetical protein
MKPNLTSTVKEVKEYLRENSNEGVKCPCCDQLVKVYKRKLNSGMSFVLIQLYKNRGYINVKDFLRKNSFKNNHDWTLLKYWGLIEEHYNDDESKKSSGVWKITNKGIDFVLNRITVSKHVLIYNKRYLGSTDEQTTIKECLGENFDFNELMNN